MSSKTGVSGFFANIREKIVDHFEDYEVNRETILFKISFLFILIIALIVRVFVLIKGYDTLIKAFDPYVQLKSTEYIINNGFRDFLHWFKINSWYPYGFKTGQELYWGVPISGVIVYGLLKIFSVNVSIQFAAFITPAIFGIITVIASYYLGKEVGNSRVGLFMAFFMAISPAYLSRSTAGFFDNESVGILFVVLTLYFFIKGMKTGRTGPAFLAGISLAILMGSWGAYRYMLDLLPLATVILVFTGKLTHRLLKTYTISITTAIMIGFIVPRVLANKFVSIDVLIPIFIIGFLVVVGVLQNISRSLDEQLLRQFIIGAATILVIILVGFIGIFLALGIFSNIAEKFWAVILPGGRVNIPIISSVSEHQPMTWSQLFSNIHIMAFLIPLGMYYLLKKPTDVNIFLIVYGLTTIYFSGSMVRLILLLAPAAALLSAIAIDRLLYTYALSAHGKIALTKRKIRVAKSIGRDEAILAYLVIFGLMIGFSIHSIKMASQLAQIEMQPVFYQNGIPSTDWQEALLWLRENVANSEGIIPGSPAVVLSWWDYGYWLTNYGNVTTLVDNATTNKTQIGVVGTMLMWNFTESVKLMYKYNIKYVLVHSAGGTRFGSDLHKAIWCIRIAESTVPQFGVKESDYYGEKEGTQVGSVYLDKFYQSVLYKLAAYDKESGWAFPQDPDGQLGSPIGKNPGILELAKNYPVKDLSENGFVYFKEVFRSYGLTQTVADQRMYPFVRIYEVIYPPNIAQLAAELDYVYPSSS